MFCVVASCHARPASQQLGYPTRPPPRPCPCTQPATPACLAGQAGRPAAHGGWLGSQPTPRSIATVATDRVAALQQGKRVHQQHRYEYWLSSLLMRVHLGRVGITRSGLPNRLCLHVGYKTKTIKTHTHTLTHTPHTWPSHPHLELHTAGFARVTRGPPSPLIYPKYWGICGWVSGVF